MLLVALWRRRQYALYYGTLARSLAPVYALSILFLTLAVQPWLRGNEAYWLHRDTAFLGYLTNGSRTGAGFTVLETQKAQRVTGMVLGAIDVREGER